MCTGNSNWITDIVQSARQGRRAAPATPAVDLEQDDDLDTPVKPDVSERFLSVHVCKCVSSVGMACEIQHWANNQCIIIIFICIQTYTYTCMHACAHTHTHTQTCTYTVYMCVCVRVTMGEYELVCQRDRESERGWMFFENQNMRERERERESQTWKLYFTRIVV